MPRQPVRVRDREAVTKSRSYQPLQTFWELFLSTRIQLLAVAALVLIANQASAADFPVKITAARVGLPSGGGDTGAAAKFACWAPVYVDLELTGPVADAAELVVEAADPDEISTSLAVAINLAGASGKVSAAERGAIGYVRPAGVGEVTITVRAANGGKTLSEPFRVRSLRPRDPLTYVVLSLGAQPTGFELPKPTTGGADQSAGLRGGRVELAAIADFAQLPDQWFGYEAADLVVLHTGPGSDEFLRKLFGESASATEKAKQFAFKEWVRRGGRLVVAIGANAEPVAQYPALKDLLPFEVNGSRAAATVALSWGAREASQSSTFSGTLTLKGGTVAVAQFVPKAGRPARVLIPPPDRQSESKDIIAGQWAYGLGRVTAIAFDLDRPPFTEFALRAEFWDWVLREGGATRASAGSEGKPRPVGAGLSEEEDELSVALRTHADTFDSVPVVSFGWLAILIVLYILLIGPIEYFFLKRVLGRLELTWITFPIIVLTVSLAAYFTAYSMKGRELKINKIDVVDFDPASGRVYGTTLFTLFSPRIDDYTIGVSPGDGWSLEPESTGTAVSWVGAPRGGRASLLRRTYRYHTGDGRVADGLEKVPVQVWSTKSFTANWTATIDRDLFDPKPSDPNNSTDVENARRMQLKHPAADLMAVEGWFVNRLPVPVLSDCVLFYAGKAYPIPGGTIRAGETIRFPLETGQMANDWLKKESKLEDLLRRADLCGTPRSDESGRPAGRAASRRCDRHFRNRVAAAARDAVSRVVVDVW